MNATPEGFISAVVRTWNSDRTLVKTLCSLRRQTEKIGEIIVVDSGSTDRTRAIADRFGCRWIEYPAGREFNYSESLNLGIAATTGELILIISSHTVLCYPDILGTMRRHLARHAAAGVYCTYTSSRACLPKRHTPGRGALTEVNDGQTFHGYNGLSNSCSLIERTCWDLHPFDVTMPNAEDQEWALWFFRHTSKPTVRIKSAGVLYKNPHHCIEKVARERVVIATRLRPALRSWRAISRLFIESIASAVRGRRKLAQRDFAVASALLKSRFFTPRYSSRYYKQAA